MFRTTTLTLTLLATLAAATAPARAQREVPTGQRSQTLERRIAQLETTVQLLTAQLAQLDNRVDEVESAGSSMIGFTQQGSALVLAHSGTVRIDAAGALEFRAGSTAKLEAATTLDVKGAVVILNGGGRPVSGSGHIVTGNVPSGSGALVGGKVAEGSATVFVP
jgi:hypothetical protein